MKKPIKVLSPVMPPQAVLHGLYSIADVMALLNVKKTYATKVVADLNAELAENGFRPFKAGTISRLYFHQRYYCDFDVSGVPLPGDTVKGGEKNAEKDAV